MTQDTSKPSMTKRMIVVLLALLLVFGAIFGFKAFVNTKMGEFFDNFQPPPATVSTAVAEATQWQPTIPAVGTLRAYNGVDVTAEVAGVVREINFQSGQRVAAGDILLQLDTETDRAELAALEATRALANTQLQRQRELYSRRSTPKAELDSAQAEARRISAQITAAQARLAKKTIRAPFPGTLGIRHVDLGGYVAPGTVLINLEQLSPILLDFSLPEQQIPNVDVGKTVEIRVDAFPDQTFTGTITAIDPRISSTTRSVPVQAEFTNEARGLRPGMFARVDVLKPTRDGVITLPRTAIAFNPYGDSVFLVTDAPSDAPSEGQQGDSAQASGDQPPAKVVQRVFVKLGQTRGDQVEVLSGVAEGDEVVTAGQLKLSNGSRVVIDNERQPSNEAAPQPENT